MTVFRSLHGRMVLPILLMLSLGAACGTFEVGIVHVDQPGGTGPTRTMPREAVVVRTAIGTQPQPTVHLERVPSVPTPTGQQPTPEPAFTPQAMESFTAPAGLRVALVKEGEMLLALPRSKNDG